jgi:hypothetical protein
MSSPGPALSLPSPLGAFAETLSLATESVVADAGDAFTESARLAHRVAVLRRELEDRRDRLTQETRQVESALLNLADTPADRPPAAAAPTVPRVITTKVVYPPLQDEHDVRGAVVLLLRVNPWGLRTTELAEAIRSSSLRPRKNELHNVVRSLFDAGVLTREGFRGGYVYRLRAEPEN